ncbi:MULTISPECIES: Zn-dependent hydrolase [Ralstonia solanacearum species complex]|uniref:Peptidase M20 dimerisation domain-containing protein n=3 Tax=Ralstonia solanacearum species complex TaxID=3116862 RepID=A0ABF7RFJ2_RALSL|nr:Zn-dependent hydrolase [Ralstonia solanacearum]ALF87138.1 N-carbamoyl-L-amino acid hydrolase [Ralstonia solanacearum]ATI26683.1 Zn-dependent hydrolase [Ralstonia solanacearum]EAP73242.1 N-carbamoyl-L-amino acid amidohydrolase [Ralstonia solanacearum UW551]KEI31810.1 allantoate amidohydrolase [Ralstonia solanacearum]KFX80429.1 allantoate amidohydrolase [Ralstonia solanacearum]
MQAHQVTHPDIELDGARLLAQLRALGEVGADPDAGGRTRIALTDDERAGRDLVVRWMRALDLDVRIDRIGNIFGTLRSGSDTGGEAPLMIGSHIDTVTNAGALDGCYGVLAGLAVAHAFRQAGIRPHRSITIAAFTNEEGVRYQPDMMGSLVYAGGLALEDALNTIGTDGTKLGDELARIGYAGDMEPGAIVPHAYLELHIEQGPILEADNTLIGVVENLQGISWQQVTVQGNANHAGTTPTHLRHDAGWTACAIVDFLRELAVASSGTTLATVGCMRFEPNVINVIPRRATFTVDLRDPDEARLQAAEQRLADFLNAIAEREGVKIGTERLVRFEPVVFDRELADEIEASAQRLGLSHRRMTSGAGHDAQMIARIAPSAMIFVPSRGGISHNPREHTDDDQLVMGARVLLDVVLRRLGQSDVRAAGR